MLKFMRDKVSSWFIKGILMLAAISFAVGGFYFGGSDKADIVAKVEGSVVSAKEYKETYDDMIKFYKNIYKNELPASIRESIKKNALEQLIQTRLLAKEISKARLVVSDDEIRERIKSNQNLQNDGIFDWNDYAQIAPERRHEYENALHREILFKKMEDIVKDGVKLSPEELKDAYSKENEQVRVEYIQLAPGLFIEKAEITDEKLNEYFSKNNEQYKIPEKRKAEYAITNGNNFEKDVQIDDEMFKNYYHEHRDEYSVDEGVRASHILIKAAKGNAEAEKKAKETAKKVLKEIKEGGDFAELAKKYSEDSTASKGGDLGYFTKGRMVKEFEEAAFSLKKGEVSDIVKTNFGYHIIMVTDTQSAHIKPLEEVRSSIEQNIKRLEGKKLARRRIKKLNRMLEKKPETGLQKAAEKLSIPLKTTNFFARGGSISGISGSQSFIQDAFVLKKDEISGVIKGGNEYYLIKLVDIQESYVPDMDQVRKEVEEDFKNEESKRLAEEKIKEFLKNFNDGTDFAELTKDMKVAIKSPDFFKRGGSIPEVGRDEGFIKTAFTLDPGKAKDYISGQRYYLIKVLEKKGADEKNFSKEKKKFEEKLIKQKQNMVFQTWLASLREKADVWVNEFYQ